MASAKLSKDELLRRSWQVFHRQGFWFTTMDDLAEACGLRKSAFYHHYPNKESLFRDVILFAHDFYKKNVLSVADEADLPTAERLEKFFRRQFRLAAIDDRGCFYGNSILETSVTTPELKPIFQKMIEESVEALSRIFAEKMLEATARDRAEQAFMEYQGAVMLIKLTSDLRFKEDFIRRTLAKIGEQPTRAKPIFSN